MSETSGVDLVLVAFTALSDEEQERAYEQLSAARLERLAGREGEAARFIRSLKRVQEHLGEPPNSTTYREAWRELREQGEEVENLTAVINHFGSWRLAREALGLVDASKPRAIEARFARRRLNKVQRYTAATLRETVARCVAELEHVPRLAEFEFWRERQMELARARGDDAYHLPSPQPYRRRYGTWANALLAFGYTSDEVEERLERQ